MSSKKRVRQKKEKVENAETDNSSVEEVNIDSIELENDLSNANFKVDIPLKKLKRCLTKSNNITLIYKEKFKTTTYNILCNNTNEMTALYMLSQMNKLGFSTSYAIVFITDIVKVDNDVFEICYERMVDTENYEKFIHH